MSFFESSHKRIRRAIDLALESVNAEIAGMSHGKYGRGLAGEGYCGGYRDALMDVSLLLDGVTPNRRDYWQAAKETVR